MGEHPAGMVPVAGAPGVRALRTGAFAALAGLLAAGCAVGPDYQRPNLELPPAWKAEAPWHVAQPADGQDAGAWWKVFGDAQLDELETAALAANGSLAVASERLAQARAVVDINFAALLPQVNAYAGDARNKVSANRPRGFYNLPNVSTVQNDLTAGFAVRYEADLFGRNRRALESARALQEQAQADLANARLVVTAEVAADYLNLRELDLEIDVVRKNIEAERAALAFVTTRHDSGAASGLDLAQQQAQLDGTVTQIDLLRVRRDEFEHALARLTGQAAPAFAIAPRIIALEAPAVAPGVPADLLQRRPDVASAERAMAAANAQIGIARAAFFPGITLAGAYGVESTAASNLFSAPSLLWSLGVAASQPLFEGGRLQAGIDLAQSGYRASVATYRDTVLQALQEVQDGLSGMANLERAAAEADAAVASARRVADLANARYTGGLANYLDVVTAQQTLLANERLQAQIRGQRAVTAVYLVKALGGPAWVQAAAQPSS